MPQLYQRVMDKAGRIGTVVEVSKTGKTVVVQFEDVDRKCRVSSLTDYVSPAEQIGTANAETAIDQVDAYEDLADAVDSYWENACDTLVEECLTGSVQFEEMRRAFTAVLVTKGIGHRSHGCG